LEFSISATSRVKRGNEIDGVDYYFLTHDEFNKRIKNKEFIEWEEVYNGSLYGTLKSELDRIWAEGNYIIFDVDVKGGLRLKKYFKERGLSLFIRVENPLELEKRLRQRATDDEQSVQRRIRKASTEMKYERNFDKVIVNDILDKAQKEAEQFIREFLNI
jgi:guanylate kinase